MENKNSAHLIRNAMKCNIKPCKSLFYNLLVNNCCMLLFTCFNKFSTLIFKIRTKSTITAEKKGKNKRKKEEQTSETNRYKIFEK